MPERKERWEPTEKENALSNRLLTTGQASLVLNVHANTLRRWSDLGIIETYRIGLRGDRRFRLGDLVKLLSEEAEGEPQRPGQFERAKRPDPAT